MSQNRRSFLKFILGAGAGITASPVMFKLMDDVSIWTQNWSWIPSNPRGADSFELTTSKLCPSASGLRVRLVGGQPVRALPNPQHPLGGGLSALAAAEVQLMHSPARVQAPLRRSSEGAYVRISWDEAMRALGEGLSAAGAKVAAISGDETGTSMDLLSAFLKSRDSEDLFMMPSEMQAASRAWALMGGDGQVGYNLEGCDYILAIGANVLESWGTFIRNRRLFAAARPHGQAPAMRLVYAGPVQNNTAAVAEQWVSMKPGGEAALALGLAALLVQRGRSLNSTGMPAFRQMLAEFTPQKVEALTGISPDVLRGLAEGLSQAKKPAVLVGSGFGQGGGAAAVMAGFAVNLLLDKDVLRALPLARPVAAGAKTRTEIFRKDLVSYLAGGPSPKAMIFYEANPVYGLPAPEKTAAALAAVPFKVSFSAFMDETASLCDLVLPMPLGLERLDDIENPYGCGKAFYALSRKVVPPAVDARHGMDVLLAVSARFGAPLFVSYEDALRAKAAGVGAKWERLQAGEAFESDKYLPRGQVKLNAQELASAGGKSAGAGLGLAPMWKIAMGTAQTGIPPFNVKTIRASELAGKEMGVFMNSATAYGQGGLQNGDRVALSAGGNVIRARVQINEGVAADVVAVNMGFGHTALDAFSQNKGANVAELFTAVQEPGTGLSVWNRSGVSVTKV